MYERRWLLRQKNETLTLSTMVHAVSVSRSLGNDFLYVRQQNKKLTLPLTLHTVHVPRSLGNKFLHVTQRASTSVVSSRSSSRSSSQK
ncbi:hypothetical protein NDU88_001450 [Pleurodeles waltl]|uniref:Uncharacterized protein n=1 Tax=Pleurodeles waltl TaxID=8319 RepID=A0AAV7RAE9_PLEWA|nr:hypothetical protein NDU88_001450 [Pleurodeles waltl]